jgi:hypothetical protein
MKKLAPIILFTYNRLNTLKTTIQFLKKNKLARQSNIYIYSDFYKSNADKHNVLKVRKFLKSIRGFNQKNIILRKKNYGLAKNIIKGVTEIFKRYKKAIILEDDIKVSKYFLSYMNNSLDLYQKKKKVWHISGWNYNIKVVSKNDAYFIRTMNCWGWATWKDRWKHFSKDAKKIKKDWSASDIFRFNLDGSHNFFSQIERNLSKKINTWAIFWYATIFQNNGLCLNPKSTLVANIGMGKLATNTKFFNNIHESRFDDLIFLPKKLPRKLKEDQSFFKAIKKKFVISKIKNQIKYNVLKLIK